MKERPIIFSTDMVRAIRNGTKTMTRRVIKPQPFNQALIPLLVTPNTWGWFKDGRRDLPEGKLLKCPYGQVGDRLWVRETWCRVYGVDDDFRIAYKADGIDWQLMNLKWKPSIHMFRKDSRILLEITEIRAERLWEISRDDIVAEGLPRDLYSYQNRFMNLWDSLNAKRGYGWEVNPWVWVIGFKVSQG